MLTVLYDATRDIKLERLKAENEKKRAEEKAKAFDAHVTAAMTLKHYVKGRNEEKNTALPVATLYGLTDS